VAGEERWTDLHDPDEATLVAALPPGLHVTVLDRLRRPASHGDEPRPRLQAHGTYVFGVLVVPAVTSDGVVGQEINLVATPERLVTIHKTPQGAPACDVDDVRAAALRDDEPVGMCLYELFDEIAERFLSIIDDFDDKIDKLEDNASVWEAAVVRRQISDTRHDILRVRRVLTPTRDAARAVLDDRVELDTTTIFPRDVELHFADAYDKLLRATDGLDLSRDLLAGVRDYHQAEVANDQNEVMKRLTVVASVLLVPTFIVGLYGQNLRGSPELHWRHGYLFSWALIIAATAFQLWYFRRKKWI
jgi:magnesium transporter